jgi:accessory colonization factor AcfC
MVFLASAGDDDVVHIREYISAKLSREKVDLAFLSPSGILMKQYVPKGVMKLVLTLSSSFMYI